MSLNNYQRCRGCQRIMLGHTTYYDAKTMQRVSQCMDCQHINLVDAIGTSTTSVSSLTDTRAQPAPKPTAAPSSWELVQADMRERDKFGREKYGTPLQPGNGRDQLVDAYQEALDLCVYLRTAIHERDGK